MSKRSYVEQKILYILLYFVCYHVLCAGIYFIFYYTHSVYAYVPQGRLSFFFYFIYMYVHYSYILNIYSTENMYSHFYAHIIDCVCLCAYECGVVILFLCAKQTFIFMIPYFLLLLSYCPTTKKKVKSGNLCLVFIGILFWIILLRLSMNN